ncbi:hypothetical protein DXB59_00045 [Ruminococcus sp. OM05-10BH]|nr:hypothetical protein DXB59_00045 [Ruminococcus sp. OM05-10BH]
MFSINFSKEVSRNKKRFRPEDGMKKSELSIDVESYLADMERLGSDTGRKKPEFAMVFRYFASIYIFLHLKFFCCSYLDIRRYSARI